MILRNKKALPMDDPIQECERVNDVLMFWHAEATGQHNPDCWNTFKGWKERGFSVQKGESGFLIWGTPRKMKGKAEQRTEAGTIEEIEKEYSAFPLCYLFHTGQVKNEDGKGFKPDKASLAETETNIVQEDFCFDEEAPEEPKHRGRADYYQRQVAKLERAEELANKHNVASNQRQQASRKILDFIPPGQPILIGHHSEKRHRSDLNRVDNHMRKAIEHNDKANHFADKAAAIERTLEGNGAISSDAPDAVERLQEKIAEAEKKQTMMKSVNAAIRKHVKAGKEAQFAELMKLDLTEEQAKRVLTPDCHGNTGYASYSLQNNNANIRRMKKRVQSLEAGPQETTERIEAGVKIIENVEENRIQLVFDGKPEESVREILKRYGFRWSRNVGAWQRLLNGDARWAAQRIIQALAKD